MVVEVEVEVETDGEVEVERGAEAEPAWARSRLERPPAGAGAEPVWSRSRLERSPAETGPVSVRLRLGGGGLDMILKKVRYTGKTQEYGNYAGVWTARGGEY